MRLHSSKDKFLWIDIVDDFSVQVVVMGPESVGKSTLMKKLAVHYDTYYVEEYGRTYTELSGTHSISNQDFINIAEGQVELIEKTINKGEKVIFVDTEAMTTKIFGEMYLGNEFDPTNINKIIKNQKFDLYLLLDIDVPWVDDGTREFPHARVEHFERIKKELTDNNISYVLISGDYNERFEKAVKEVDKLGYLY
jgi:HTH-type transcriptional repressor of NAD biosynthesis genes